MSGGTEQHRDGRSMASPRRGTRAEPTPRPPAARDPGAQPPLSNARRAGVLVVVAALTGSIALAVGGGGTRPTAPPEATPTVKPRVTASPAPTRSPSIPVPAVVPVITPPSGEVLTERETSLEVTVPDPGVPLRTLEMRVYRVGRAQPLLEGIRVREGPMIIRRVPLRQGENRITVVLANAGGEGPRAEPVVITVDSQAPPVDVRQPGEGDVIDGLTVAVRGVTDPGLTVTIANRTLGETLDAVSDARGVFIAELRLGPGQNRLEVLASDAVGNVARVTRTVMRGESTARVNLTSTRAELRLGQLPTDISIRLELLDPQDQPIKGAQVTFVIYVPGQRTQLFEAVTSEDGIARWEGVVIPREGAEKGDGFVTARAVLAQGLSAASKTIPLDIK